ncbi:hypothetical protein [Pyrobaculum islandicum]|nr:hypothetical protein [Pyrobaculum islandicum]
MGEKTYEFKVVAGVGKAGCPDDLVFLLYAICAHEPNVVKGIVWTR